MIDDKIRHNFNLFAKRADVIPIPESRVDLSVINRVEAGIRAVNRDEKRQQMHTAENAFQEGRGGAPSFASSRRPVGRRKRSVGPDSSKSSLHFSVAGKSTSKAQPNECQEYCR